MILRNSRKSILAVFVFSTFICFGFSQSNTQSSPTDTQRDRNSQNGSTNRDHSPLNTPAPSGAGRQQSDIHRDQSSRGATTSVPLAQAIEMNAAEIEAGRMASGKAMNPRVKEFAEMMVKDHTAALTKLQSLENGTANADVKPNAKHRETAARLGKLSGETFDREYMQAMVTDHQQAVKFFEQHSKTARSSNASTGKTASGQVQSGGDLASVAAELLPTVRQHLMMAQDIQKELQGSGNKGNTGNSNGTNSTTGGSTKNRTTPSNNTNGTRGNESTGKPEKSSPNSTTR